MPSDNENDTSPEPAPSTNYTADRFVPARDAGSLSVVYSAVDDPRSQEVRSPEPNKGPIIFHMVF